MSGIEVFALIIILSYLLMVIFFLYGWLRMDTFHPQGKSCSTYLSVIIPVRNEEKNICSLLGYLRSQDYPKDKYEVILVDDHSTDNTAEKARHAVKQDGTFRIVSLEEGCTGKKAALHKGISLSNGSLIVTTDGDCRMNRYWLLSIAEFYEAYHPAMIIGPVILQEDKSLFGQMQALEFLSLSGSAGGSAAIRLPVLCNGANLTYEKKVYEENMDGLMNQFASGDDMLLMLHIKKTFRNRILFLKSPEAIVYSPVQDSFSELIGQRKRWVSKSRAYRNAEVIGVSMIVFFTNLTILIGFAALFFFPLWLDKFIFFIFLKLLTDFIFLQRIATFYKKKHLLRVFLPLQLFYYIYIVVIVLIGQTGFTWKDRKWKQ